MNIPRAIGLAQALAHPPVLAQTEEAALIQIEVARVAGLILEALDAPEQTHVVLEGELVPLPRCERHPDREAIAEIGLKSLGGPRAACRECFIEARKSWRESGRDNRERRPSSDR